MKVSIPFLTRKPSSNATAHPEHRPRQAARIITPSASPYRLRPFSRWAPTTYQRCLATHIYFAEHKSALD